VASKRSDPNFCKPTSVRQVEVSSCDRNRCTECFHGSKVALLHVPGQLGVYCASRVRLRRTQIETLFHCASITDLEADAESNAEATVF
jgi:hypothetical protein